MSHSFFFIVIFLNLAFPQLYGAGPQDVLASSLPTCFSEWKNFPIGMKTMTHVLWLTQILYTYLYFFFSYVFLSSTPDPKLTTRLTWSLDSSSIVWSYEQIRRLRWRKRQIISLATLPAIAQAPKRAVSYVNEAGR